MKKNTKLQTTAFATFSPYKPCLNRLLSRLSLMGAWTNTNAARDLKFLHAAHFSVVSPRKLQRAGLLGKNTRHGALLFISAYNGDAEEYFRGFSNKVAKVLNTVWCWCVHWKRAVPYENLQTYIDAYERPTLSFFSAYPASSTRLRASLVLRRQLDRLHALALTGTDADFKKEYDRVMQTQWGNVQATEADL